MIKNNYLIGSKNESFGPGGIQNAINDTLVRTKGAVDAKLIDKNVSENGVYNAKDDGADGYSSVEVDIPGVGNNANYPITENLSLSDIESLEIPSGVTSLRSQNAFANTKLKYVKIPGTLQTIAENAFYGCELLETVIIESGVKRINSQAFASLGSLLTIELPNTITSMSSDVFRWCNNLTSIVIHKPEGSISGAPWGATNAEVIWNG